MYLAVAVLLILATASPLTAQEIPATGSGKLAKEFQDILDLIPLNELFDITHVYAAKDVEFRALLRLVGSDDTKKLIEFVESAPELKELFQYVQNHGVDIYYIANMLNEVFDLAPFVPLRMYNRKITGGISGYVKDVADFLPMDEMMELIMSKMDKPGPFSDLVHFIMQDRFLEFYQSLSKNEHYLVLEELATGLGVDREQFKTYLPILINAYFVLHLTR